MLPIQKKELILKNSRIQVFEHQVLAVGDRQGGVVFSDNHFESLLRFYQKKATKFFTPIYKGIRFSHYVGVLQTGNLTIEILPKADAQKAPDTGLWQSVLIDMLRTCRLLKTESLSQANLQLRPHAILDLYLEIFLAEIEKLLQEGLIKSYERRADHLPVLKGRLLVPAHIRKNNIQKDRFYVNYAQYTYDHFYNQLIFKALLIVEKIADQPFLREKLRQIRAVFPKVSEITVTENHFEQLKFHRQTQRYAVALDIARLLILNFSPDITKGNNHVLAILFDMNLLWEEFIYRQLKTQQNDHLQVSRQQQKPFWQRRYLRPDIVLKSGDKNIVIDTKWKILTRVSPSMEDLRQMYIYQQYFDAEKSVLLYPNVHHLDNLPATAFEQTEEGKKYACQVAFIDLLKNHGLDRNLGTLILEKIS